MAEFRARFQEPGDLRASFADDDPLAVTFGETQTITTSDYPGLNHKPQINSVELVGNKSFEDLGDNPLTNIEIKAIFDRIFGG